MTRGEAIAVLNMVEAHGSLVIQAKEMAIQALEQEPKTGHWIDDCGGVKCSCCGYSIDDCFYAKTYCTNCGCRMESEVAECR
jgi:hypothetical protein